MKRLPWRDLLAAALLFCGLAVQAAPATDRAYAVVDSVQMPAWVERNGVRQPLEAGKILQNRDRVLTGDDARVQIQLAEGSAIKLGEEAQLELNALGWRDKRVFTAALDVVKGAFRFTSGVFSKQRQPRAVNIRVATITAGIRGTDLWGRSDDERDLVCLLEGRITVMHPQAEAVGMNEPLSCYTAKNDEAPEPVAAMDAAQVAIWAAQTEVQAESGSTRRGGKWKVELATVDGEAETLALYDRARAAGYAVHIKPRAAEDGGYRYSVQVTQLPSKAEAGILASKLAAALELASPVVRRY